MTHAVKVSLSGLRNPLVYSGALRVYNITWFLAAAASVRQSEPMLTVNVVPVRHVRALRIPAAPPPG